MELYRNSHHAYRLMYHFGWTPKYRHKVFAEPFRADLKAIIQKIGYDYDIEIVELENPLDHIHMVVRTDPKTPFLIFRKYRAARSEIGNTNVCNENKNEKSMKYLEIRRHTMRRKPGQHLSQDDIKLARHVGDSLGSYHYVVTSTVPRAIQTAIALGYEVNETIETIGEVPEDILSIVGWPKSFAEVTQVIGDVAKVSACAKSQADVWRKVAASLPDNTSALLVTHGSVIELGAVACMPNADHATWGDAMGYCEGLQMSFDADFVACNVQRLAQKYKLISN